MDFYDVPNFDRGVFTKKELGDLTKLMDQITDAINGGHLIAIVAFQNDLDEMKAKNTQGIKKQIAKSNGLGAVYKQLAIRLSQVKRV